MLYKFIDNRTIKHFSGMYVDIDGIIYTNPTEETLRLAGYKELEDSKPPEYNPETQYLDITYKSGSKIKVIYTVKDIELTEAE